MIQVKVYSGVKVMTNAVQGKAEGPAKRHWVETSREIVFAFSYMSQTIKSSGHYRQSDRVYMIIPTSSFATSILLPERDLLFLSFLSFTFVISLF